MFQKIYDKILVWAKHPHASHYLFLLSFSESSFFPIPPDVMLAPMSLSQPHKAFHFALLTTLASVLGGILGYGIGYFLFDSFSPWLKETHYWHHYLQAEIWFKDWGFWAVFIAGFSPIPYKVFTIAAGTLQMFFLPFVVASIIGRGARFFLIATIAVVGGKKLDSKLRQYMDIIGWGTLLFLILGFGLYKVLSS